MFVVLWFLLFVSFFKFKWNYVFVRPSVHQDMFRMSQLDGISYFGPGTREDLVPESKDAMLERLSQIPEYSARGNGYYDLQVQALVAIRHAGFDPADAPDLPKSDVTRVISAFRKSDVMPKDEFFDRRMDKLGGIAVAFRTHDAEKAYFIAADAGPNWHDQVPYYEVLFDRNLKVFHAQSYTVEWAGIEGLELPYTIGLTFVCTLFLVGGIVVLFFLHKLALTIKDAFT